MRAALTTLLLLSACTTPRDVLLLELRTDYIPGIEFGRVELREDAVVRHIRVVERADVGRDWTEPTPLAEVELGGGFHRLELALLDGGEIVATRPFAVDIAGRTGVSLVIARSCEDVMCPAAGGAPAATACLGGVCVPETCLSGVEAECGFTPECTTDEECPDSPCAPYVCEAPGFCFPAAFECGANEYCEVARGCQPIAEADVDAGFDARGPDAGVDSGIIDSGADAGDAGSAMDAGALAPVVSWVVGFGADIAVQTPRVVATDDGACFTSASTGTLAIRGTISPHDESYTFGQPQLHLACLRNGGGAPEADYVVVDSREFTTDPIVDCFPGGACGVAYSVPGGGVGRVNYATFTPARPNVSVEVGATANSRLLAFTMASDGANVAVNEATPYSSLLAFAGGTSGFSFDLSSRVKYDAMAGGIGETFGATTFGAPYSPNGLSREVYPAGRSRTDLTMTGAGLFVFAGPTRGPHAAAIFERSSGSLSVLAASATPAHPAFAWLLLVTSSAGWTGSTPVGADAPTLEIPADHLAILAFDASLTLVARTTFPVAEYRASGDIGTLTRPDGSLAIGVVSWAGGAASAYEVTSDLSMWSERGVAAADEFTGAAVGPRSFYIAGRPLPGAQVEFDGSPVDVPSGQPYFVARWVPGSEETR